MLKKILILGITLIFAPFAFAQQESVTITTYYPSPYGSYKELRVQRMAIGESYYGSDYCWSPETCTNVIDANADLVVEGNVGIGTTAATEKLEVAGNARVTGNILIGYEVVTNAVSGAGHYNVDVYCSSGKTVIGGGCSQDDVSASTAITDNRPIGSTGWHCRTRDIDTSTARTTTAWAICARVGN
jgi:hypothetical protein